MREFKNHRYILHRNWIGTGRRVNFIPVNPSTADDRFDDATVRKMIGFAKRWGFSHLDVTNAFAYRATLPGDLQKLAIADVDLAIGGADNDRWIVDTAKGADTIVVAWGGHGRIMGRDEDVLRLLADFDLYCIGKTVHGDPIHPCRAAYTTTPVLFRKALCCASVL